MKRYIIAVESGFVFVGEPYGKEEHSIRVENAKNIRKFGTTKGLGQLALSGKTKDTVLDDVGTMHINTDKILFLIEVDPNVDL